MSVQVTFFNPTPDDGYGMRDAISVWYDMGASHCAVRFSERDHMGNGLSLHADSASLRACAAVMLRAAEEFDRAQFAGLALLGRMFSGVGGPRPVLRVVHDSDAPLEQLSDAAARGRLLEDA